MTTINDLLSQARLLRDRAVPRDIVPTDTHPAPGSGTHPAPPRSGARPGDVDPHLAAEDLRGLCATLITHTPEAAVAHFLTDQLPEPRSALILACVLQLTDTEDAARFWWQYAAGAGQSAAAYCLHLHHLARGEEDTARFWHDQMDHTTSPEPALAPDHGERLDTASIPTLLRVLQLLARQNAPRPASATTTSLMSYMTTATAVGYLREPEMELPLPGPDFARTIRTLLDAAAPRPGLLPGDRPRPRRRTTRTVPTAPTRDQVPDPEPTPEARTNSVRR
ncbi:hypothetical protein [Streptomyces californicus]|uniref:hypothetical protein n=1 Tax=Streptomyces californicus TaxID=67351 RepID=UPI0034097504